MWNVSVSSCVVLWLTSCPIWWVYFILSSQTAKSPSLSHLPTLHSQNGSSYDTFTCIHLFNYRRKSYWLDILFQIALGSTIVLGNGTKSIFYSFYSTWEFYRRMPFLWSSFLGLPNAKTVPKTNLSPKRGCEYISMEIRRSLISHIINSLLFFLFRLHSIVLVVESGLFGLFVTAIMCDQLQAIFGDETAVEQAKQQGPYRYWIHFPVFLYYEEKNSISMFCFADRGNLVLLCYLKFVEGAIPCCGPFPVNRRPRTLNSFQDTMSERVAITNFMFSMIITWIWIESHSRSKTKTNGAIFISSFHWFSLPLFSFIPQSSFISVEEMKSDSWLSGSRCSERNAVTIHTGPLVATGQELYSELWEVPRLIVLSVCSCKIEQYMTRIAMTVANNFNCQWMNVFSPSYNMKCWDESEQLTLSR